jgi:V8-like Glu-specific endopeptidase
MSGHQRVTNFAAEEAAVNEAAMILEAAESRHDRQSLAYYRAPQRRRRIEESVALTDVPSSEETVVDAAAASFGDSTILEVVIGRDDRVKVKNTLLTQPPWRQICALRIRASTGRAYVGTGWFVGPRLLATAGHCVYMQDEGGWAESIEVLAALRGNSAAGRATSTRFGSVTGWVREHKRDFDYGVIFLDDDSLGKRLGNFAVESMGDAGLRGRQAKISGYPADRDRAEYQYFHERPVMSTTSATFVYDIDTYGGQSGSPVWCDTEEDGLVAVGIHTTGSALGNSATRITDEVIDNLIYWTGNHS